MEPLRLGGFLFLCCSHANSSKWDERGWREVCGKLHLYQNLILRIMIVNRCLRYLVIRPMPAIESKPLFRHLNDFLEYCEVEEGLSPMTVANYSRFLARFFEWLRSRGLAELTPKELTAEERRAQEVAAFKEQTKNQVTLLAIGGLLVLLAGLYAPASFMQHFIVFVLAVFIGFQVIWNVAHSLHTPLMAITNAISSIIIVGALMQMGSGSFLIVLLAALSVFMAGINIFGGFLVTRRMLAMFQKS